MKKYRIKEIIDSFGNTWYRVEYQRKKFFAFGPLIWVNAGSFDDGYYGTDEFFTYEEAYKFMESLYRRPSARIVKEVEVIIVVGLLFISSMGFGFCYDRVDEKSGFHHENAEKNGRTAAAEQRQKAADVHQKFLDAVKDDPDFRIYFEKN